MTSVGATHHHSSCWTQIRNIFSWILLLILTSHCGGNIIENTTAAAITMNISQTKLIGKDKTIAVELTVNDPALLKEYTLCMKISEQPGNPSHKSSVSYKQHNKKHTFSNSQEIVLDQLIKPSAVAGKYVCEFKLTPAKQATRVALSFELLSAKQESHAPITVTWSMSEILVQVKTIGNEHFIEVQSLSGDINDLDQWRIMIISLRGADQVIFDDAKLTSPASARLRDLLPGTTQLIQGKTYLIKIKVPHSDRGAAFIVIPIKINQDSKTTLSPSDFKFIASHYPPSTYANGVIDGWEGHVLDNTTLKQLEDEAYTKGQNIGTKIANEFNGGEWLLGLATMGVGLGVMVAIPGPGTIAGAILIPLGFIIMLDWALAPLGDASA